MSNDDNDYLVMIEFRWEVGRGGKRKQEQLNINSHTVSTTY